MDQISNILSSWKHRRLTLMGKIQVIKSLAATQLTYILAPLVTNHKIVKEINGIFYSFLWNNKGDKIKRSVMINNYESGGLKMIDFFLFNKSPKTTWIKKYLDESNRGKWKDFYELELGKYGGSLLFAGNLNRHDTLKTISVKDPFLQEIVQIWSEVNFENQIKTKQQFLELPIWHNSLIRINHNPVYYKHIFLQGISKVSHLMKDSRTFLSLPDFSNTYNIRIEPLKYFGLISALRYLYNSNFSGNESKDPVTSDSFLEAFSKSNKMNRVVYGKLITTKCTSPVKTQLKWNDRIVLNEGCTADWKSAYCLAAKCTKSTKLINFQYRLLHRILPTNLFLAKIKIEQDPNCSFCHNHHENLIRLFWDCEIVSGFWENMTEKFKQCNLIWINYQKNISIYLGLRPDTSQFSLQLNFCFLLARHHIGAAGRITRLLF